MGDAIPLQSIQDNLPNGLPHRSGGVETRLREARAILADLFGFPSFRDGQEEVIRSVLACRNTLAVMPTGGGKSLCYQIPALLEDRPTVVVSPLVSLMADQVASLSRVFGGAPEKAPVATLNSSMNPAAQRKVEEGLLGGSVKVLLAAPERFRNLDFVLMLKRVRPARLIVDEAHCVSEWGHSFRPEYLNLKRVREDLGNLQTVALTATADPRVRRDIVELLGMRDPELLVYGFDRPNLSYEVREVTDERGTEKPRRYEAVLEALKSGELPAVVYAHSRRQCESLAEYLSMRLAGAEARAYHAGMPAAERHTVQSAFMDGDLPVVVATIAFGMGVDKPNIRQVIHAYIPASIPAYVQESGRAGRDGENSSCLVLYSEQEVTRRKSLSTKTPPTARDADTLFHSIKRATANAGHGRLFVTPRELGEHASGVGPDEAAALLRNLEGVGVLCRRYNLWREVRVELIEGRPSHRDEPGGVAKATRYPTVETVLTVIKREARHGKLSMALLDLAREAGVTPPVAQGSLVSLATSNVIAVSGRGTLADVSVKVESLSEKDLYRIGARLKEQAGLEALHIDHVEDYLSSDTCRRQRLLDYFGDAAADLVAPCGGCDVCGKETNEAEAPLMAPAKAQAPAQAPAQPTGPPAELQAEQPTPDGHMGTMGTMGTTDTVETAPVETTPEERGEAGDRAIPTDPPDIGAWVVMPVARLVGRAARGIYNGALDLIRYRG